MKTFSKLAMVLALSGGAAATPAIAKDKPVEAKAGLKFSPEILKAAQGAQTALAAKDTATAAPLVAEVEAGAKTSDDKYLAASFRVTLEQLKQSAAAAANPNAPQDNTPLIAPLDALIANPSTPADFRSKVLFQRGAIAYNMRQFQQAATFLTQAKAAGYTSDNLDLLIVQAKLNGNDTAGGLAELNAVIDKATAAGQKAPDGYYRLAMSKSIAAKDSAGTLALMRKYLAAYPTAKNWRDMIVIYGMQNGAVVVYDKPQKLDLYRLMRATKALADQADYSEYATFAFDRGLPAETLTVLSEGAASGKLPASTSYAISLKSTAAQSLKNQGSLAALDVKAKASPNGKLASQNAEAYLAEDNNQKAIELYQLALSKGGVDTDEVNTRLGIALARSGDKAAAKSAFMAVKGPRAGIAALWTTYIDAGSTSA